MENVLLTCINCSLNPKYATKSPAGIFITVTNECRVPWRFSARWLWNCNSRGYIKYFYSLTENSRLLCWVSAQRSPNRRLNSKEYAWIDDIACLFPTFPLVYDLFSRQLYGAIAYPHLFSSEIVVASQVRRVCNIVLDCSACYWCTGAYSKPAIKNI